MAKIVQFQYMNEHLVWVLDDEGEIWCRETINNKAVWHILPLPQGLSDEEYDDA